jgi:hypothetical protein
LVLGGMATLYNDSSSFVQAKALHCNYERIAESKQRPD